MKKWKVQITGDDIDLRRIMNCFPEGETHVQELEKEFFILSDSFESLSSHHEVNVEVTSILGIWNPLVSLQWPGFGFVKSDVVIETHEDGKTTRYHSGFCAFNIRSNVDVRLDAAGQETRSQSVIRKMTGNQKKELVLKLWGHPNRSWTQLYRMVEEMEAEVGCLASAGIATKSELKRFKNSANSAAVAGLDARHRSQFDAPSNPMTLGEADELLRHLALKFLNL